MTHPRQNTGHLPQPNPCTGGTATPFKTTAGPQPQPLRTSTSAAGSGSTRRATHRPLSLTALLVVDVELIAQRVMCLHGHTNVQRRAVLHVLRTPPATAQQHALRVAVLQRLLLLASDLDPTCAHCWRTPRGLDCARETACLQERLRSAVVLAQRQLGHALAPNATAS